MLIVDRVTLTMGQDGLELHAFQRSLEFQHDGVEDKARRIPEAELSREAGFLLPIKPRHARDMSTCAAPSVSRTWRRSKGFKNPASRGNSASNVRWT